MAKGEYPGIYNYLVNTPIPHTKDQLKAYKSMEGYKYFVEGWVSEVLVHQVRRCSGEGMPKQVTVVSVGVKHSQRLSDGLLLKRRGQLYVPIAHAWQALVRLAHILQLCCLHWRPTLKQIIMFRVPLNFVHGYLQGARLTSTQLFLI